MKLRAIRPNAGLEVWLRKRLEREVEAMGKSVEWWVRAAYRAQLEPIERAANPPAKSYVAQDAAPADILQRVLESLRRRWGNRFHALGEEIAEKFAERSGSNTDAAVEAAMRAAGMRVKLQISKAQRDQLAGVVQNNVALIQSIPADYMAQVEGSVMRSVLTGRDLATLTAELQDHYGVTRRRAKLIAMQQNNAATASLTRVRQLELGVTKAIWVHSSAGKEPRRSHVAQSGKEYDVATGWFDPDAKKFCWPGSLINCRCVSRSVILPFIEDAA